MFYIIEIQRMKDGTFAHLVHTAETRNAAESTFHSVLAAAALSDLPSHSATLLSGTGNLMMTKCYNHEQEPAEEPE